MPSAANFTWVRGNDGTEYYVSSTSGVVAGSVKDAGNGADLFTVGFGGETTKVYRGAPNAKSAVETMAESERQRLSKSRK